MLTTSNGLRFIGYGATVTCPKCHNRVVEQIFVRFDDMGFAFVPVWRSRFGTESICHICRTVLETTTSGNAHRLDTRLRMASEATLQYAKTLSWLQRRTYLGDLRSLGLHDFSSFIESGCTT